MNAFEIDDIVKGIKNGRTYWGRIAGIKDGIAYLDCGWKIMPAIELENLTKQTFDQQQREIRRINMKLAYTGFSQYKDKACCGCVIHWLKVYGCKHYESVTVGNGEVSLWGCLIARVTWRDVMPIFDWQKTKDKNLNKMIDYWAENQDIWLEDNRDSADITDENGNLESLKDYERN